MIIRTVLAGLGIKHVYESKEPVKALELIYQYNIDLVITDLNMPFFDGFEIIDMIRNAKDSRNPYVPIIVLSAFSSKANVERVRDAGADYFLVKPLVPADLAEAMEKLILSDERQFVRSKTYFGPDRRRFGRPEYVGEERRSPDAASSEPCTG